MHNRQKRPRLQSAANFPQRLEPLLLGHEVQRQQACRPVKLARRCVPGDAEDQGHTIRERANILTGKVEHRG
jgi:hypothetical protein